MQKSYHTKLQRPTFLYYYQTATFLTCNEWVDHELPSKQWAWIHGIVIIVLVSKVCRLVVGIFKNDSMLLSAHCLCLVCAWTPWLPSTAQNRCIFKSTTNKSMPLLSLHQLFRPIVYLLQVGIHTHNTNNVTSTWYCKKKMSWIFFNF